MGRRICQLIECAHEYAPHCGHAGCPTTALTFHPLCLILRPVRMARPSAWGFFCRAFPVTAIPSLQVAEIFGKQHANVLRDIEYILTQLPEIFVEHNFREYEAAY